MMQSKHAKHAKYLVLNNGYVLYLRYANTGYMFLTS